MTDNKTLLLLASEMLDMASDQFSNHGCNDLNKKLIEMIPQSMCDDMRQWNSGGSDPWPEKPGQIGDDGLMSYLSFKLKEIANNQNK